MAYSSSFTFCLVLALVGSLANLGQGRENVSELSLANNDFGVKLYQQFIEGDSQNLLFSPLSIFTAFSMVESGAGGNTDTELRQALSLPKYGSISHAIRSYTVSFNDRQSPSGETLLANALYVNRRFPFKAEYLEDMDLYYGSTPRRFAPMNPEEEINEWVASKTEEHIQNFLRRGTIGPDTVFVLINAIYFKNSWQMAFWKENTKYLPFHTESSSQQPLPYVRMMRGIFPVRVATCDRLHNARILELMYCDQRYAMYIILPERGRLLSSVEDRLDDTVLEEALKATHDQFLETYDIQIPKFSLNEEADLKTLMQELGVNDLFSDTYANLTGISEGGKSAGNLFVGEAIHRAMIEVNEVGTEAAAASRLVGFGHAFSLQTFIADRPFVFVIRDVTMGVNLFMGRFVNPLERTN